MNDLIIKVLQDRATAAEVRELEAWRASSPENERLYRDTARVWRLTAAGELAAIEGREPDPREVAKRAMERRGVVVPLPGTSVRRPTLWRKRALVAAAVLFLALGLAQLRVAEDAPSLASAEIQTAEGETTTVHLADGSYVRLDSRSRLQFDPTGRVRHVWLDGRAFFAVAHAEKPFTVGTPLGEAVVLGTRFDLNARDDDLSLLVVDGRVALSTAGHRVELGRGELSVSSAGAAPNVRTVDDVLEYLDWLGQSLLFQATPLSDVVQQIERVYGADVLITEPTVADRTLTASFTNRSFEEVMGVICEVLSLSCSIDDTRARISGSSSPPPSGAVQVAPQERR